MTSFLLYGITVLMLNNHIVDVNGVINASKTAPIQLPVERPKVEVVTSIAGKHYRNIILFETSTNPPCDIYMTIYKSGWLADNRKGRAFLFGFNMTI